MRWLVAKDVRILWRSPLLVATLVIYPIVIALLVGFAISSPPGKPKVAVYSGANLSQYSEQLFSSIEPIHADSPAEAIADVRNGRALAAVIVPANIGAQIRSLIQNGTGSPTIHIVVNSNSPLERSLVEQAIESHVAEVQSAVAKQVIKVAVTDLQRVLSGGDISLLGNSTYLLGLKNSKNIISGAIDSLPPDSPLIPALKQVVSFAGIAIAGLTFATPVLSDIGSPLTVKTTELAGKTTPTSSYAVAIAIVFLLMFVALLLAAGMLALERAENAYRRLVRGLIRPEGLLVEKIVLAAACAAIETFVMAALISIFVPLDWGRVELWLLALILGGLAFGALGAAVGGLARDVSVASLLAFLISLPVAFAALVPSDSVSTAVNAVLDVISFVFPFRAMLQVMSSAFGGTGEVGLALLHLAALTLVFAGLARLALLRFGSK
jgi:ABC-type transport system involved in cytochrome c biogenesis permease component